MTLRIETASGGGAATLRLIGRIEADYLEELWSQVRRLRPRLVLDLDQVTLVDAAVVRFLIACETEGIELRHLAPYIRSRRRLINIAARILGSADDAEDLVQEAALRWLQTDLASVRTPEGWLVAVVTRLAVDRLRRTLTERQAYREVRHLTRDAEPEWTVPDRPLELASRLSDAFVLLRERLEPVERTAFVLRQMFDCGHDEIAHLLGKSEAACRQIVHRARLRQAQSRLAVRHEESRDLVRTFLEAVSAGDRDAVLAVLAAPASARLRPARRTAPAPTGRPVRVLPWRRPTARASQTPWSRSLPATPAA